MLCLIDDNVVVHFDGYWGRPRQLLRLNPPAQQASRHLFDPSLSQHPQQQALQPLLSPQQQSLGPGTDVRVQVSRSYFTLACVEHSEGVGLHVSKSESALASEHCAAQHPQSQFGIVATPKTTAIYTNGITKYWDWIFGACTPTVDGGMCGQSSGPRHEQEIAA